MKSRSAAARVTLVFKQLRSKRLVTAALSALFIIGCERSEATRVYEAPKERAQPTMAMNAPAPDDPSVAAAPKGAPGASDAPMQSPIQWRVPAGWKELPGGEMRFASMQVSADDPKLLLSIIPLGPENKLLPNVVRWQ